MQSAKASQYSRWTARTRALPYRLSSGPSQSDQTKASQAKAEADLNRIKDLFENRAAAQKEVISAETAFAEAKSEVAQSEAAVEETQKRLQTFGSSRISRLRTFWFARRVGKGAGSQRCRRRISERHKRTGNDNRATCRRSSWRSDVPEGRFVSFTGRERSRLI